MNHSFTPQYRSLQERHTLEHAYQFDGSTEAIKIGQGRENAKKYLEEHPEALEEIENKVRKKYGIGSADDDESLEGSMPAESLVSAQMVS